MTSVSHGNMSDYYDQGLGPVLFLEPARHVARYIAALGAHQMLETAAGTGIATREIFDLLPLPGRYVATDLNQGALDVAARKFDEQAGMRFEVADAMALPFAEKAFDTVLCQFGMMLFPDRNRAYAEVRRVLGPYGRFVFTVWDGVRRNPFARVLNATLRSCLPVNPPTYFETPYTYDAVDMIRDTLQDHDFENVTAHVVRLSVPIPDANIFASGFINGTRFRNEVDARGLDPMSLQDHLARAFETELGGSTPLQFLMFDAEAR